MITIVTPHYNSHTTLFRILESINILEESIDGLEWIIVDDYSNQESWHNVKDISSNYSYIKAIRLQNNYGPSIARREGVSHAKNDFVCLLDSDDIINVTNFILQFNQIQTLNKEFDFFYHVPIRIIESEYELSSKRR